MSEQIKENFCGACIAAPLALIGAGAGAGAVSVSTKGEHKKQKSRFLKIGLASLVLSVGLLVYFLYIKKCSECR